MGQTAALGALRASPVAEGLDDGQLEALAGVLESRTLADGEVLFEEGDVDPCLFLLVTGRLAVTRDVAGQDRVTLHVLRAGELVGEMGFVAGEPHIATLRALGAAEVLVLRRDSFEELVPDQPWLVYRLMNAMMRSVHAKMHRLNVQFVEMQNYVTKTHGRY